MFSHIEILTVFTNWEIDGSQLIVTISNNEKIEIKYFNLFEHVVNFYNYHNGSWIDFNRWFDALKTRIRCCKIEM